MSSNPFYTPSGSPAPGSQGSSAVIRSEFDEIADGFSMIPASIVDLTLGASFTTTGGFGTTLVEQASVSLTLPAVSGTLATLAGTEELTNKTLTASVGKGTWTASGTWTLPAVTLGGAITYGGVTLSNAVTGTGKMVLDTAATFQNSVIIGTTSSVGSLLIGCTVAFTTNGTDKNDIAFTGNSVNGLGICDTTSTNTAAFVSFRIGAGTLIGAISNNNNTGVSFLTSSGADVKSNVVPMDQSFALKVIRAAAPSTYRHKENGSVGHGFVVETAHANAMKVGADLEALGIVRLKTAKNIAAMDYSKWTPFLACVANDHEDRIAALEAEVSTLKAERE